MFWNFRRVQQLHFMQLLSTCLLLSGIMVCWDKLNNTMEVSYLYFGPSFRNDSFVISREEAYKFSNHGYLINHEDKCKSDDVFLLLFVKSTPQNFQRRRGIRSTWGNESYIESELGVSVKVLFALGVHPHSDTRTLVQQQLYREDRKYHDLIQQSFVDSFYNLTVKLLLQFNWMHAHCSQARFVISSDDDMFIHMPNLVRYLKQVSQADAQHFWLGRVFSNSGPVRWKSNKYYVSQELYPWSSYPPYTGGAAYVVSRDVALRIREASLTLNATLHIDDVFMGICASVIGVAPKAHNFFSGERKSPYHPCIYKHMMTSHGHETDLRELWKTATSPDVQTVDSGFLGKLYCSVTKLRLLCNPFNLNTYSCKTSTIF
ncbi:hypothetical protein ACEWY4_006420 [Coilia grayii]|uniref:Hexosyltransferase n=1 Tax=Coilia grayii TaxID=363190 RepID=A0ABD1KDL4_9TELE